MEKLFDNSVTIEKVNAKQRSKPKMWTMSILQGGLTFTLVNTNRQMLSWNNINQKLDQMRLIVMDEIQGLSDDSGKFET